MNSVIIANVLPAAVLLIIAAAFLIKRRKYRGKEHELKEAIRSYEDALKGKGEEV